MTSHRSPLDLIIQTSAVELLQSYGLVGAPIARPTVGVDAVQDRVVGVVEFSGNELHGSLAMSMPMEIVKLTSRVNVGFRSTELDWVKELTNQLMGRLKNRVGRFGIVILPGLPVAMNEHPRENRSRPGGEQRQFVIRTMKGDIIITLKGLLKSPAFNNSPIARGQEEGDVLLF